MNEHAKDLIKKAADSLGIKVYLTFEDTARKELRIEWKQFDHRINYDLEKLFKDNFLVRQAPSAFEPKVGLRAVILTAKA